MQTEIASIVRLTMSMKFQCNKASTLRLNTLTAKSPHDLAVMEPISPSGRQAPSRSGGKELRHFRRPLTRQYWPASPGVPVKSRSESALPTRGHRVCTESDTGIIFDGMTKPTNASFSVTRCASGVRNRAATRSRGSGSDLRNGSPCSCETPGGARARRRLPVALNHKRTRPVPSRYVEPYTLGNDFDVVRHAEIPGVRHWHAPSSAAGIASTTTSPPNDPAARTSRTRAMRSSRTPVSRRRFSWSSPRTSKPPIRRRQKLVRPSSRARARDGRSRAAIRHSGWNR